MELKFGPGEIEALASAVSARILAHLVEARPVGIEKAEALLDTKQAAGYLGLSCQRLETWRCAGDGPPFIKISKAVRYRRASLDDWLAARSSGNTSENWK